MTVTSCLKMEAVLHNASPCIKYRHLSSIISMNKTEHSEDVVGVDPSASLNDVHISEVNTGFKVERSTIFRTQYETQA